MAEGKYDKYFTTAVFSEDPEKKRPPIHSTRHITNWGGGHLSIDSVYVTRPHDMITQPHKHEFPQYLNFISANPNDPKDFDAEIEVYLGEEGEKHVITSPAAVYMEAGLLHGPIKFVKVNKPLLFLDIAVTAQYSRVGNTPD